VAGLAGHVAVQDRLDLLARAVRGEVANKEEMFVRNDVRPAGVWVSATGTPLRDQAGVMCGGVVVLSEITERKQAEEALIRDAKQLAVSVESLRKQTELFQSILSSMGDGVIVADKNGKFLNWNPAAEEILGLGAMDVPIDKLTEKYGFYLPDKITPYPAAQVPLARAVRGVGRAPVDGIRERVLEVELPGVDDVPHAVVVGVDLDVNVDGASPIPARVDALELGASPGIGELNPA